MAFGWKGYAATVCFVSDISHGLKTLSKQMMRLVINQLAIATQYTLLGQWLSDLRKLHLVGCELPDAALVAMLCRWPQATARNVMCQHHQRGWHGLAASRADSLDVAVPPPLQPDDLLALQSLQQERFGKQNINWR